MKKKLKKGDVCVCNCDNPLGSLVETGDIIIIKGLFMHFNGMYFIEWSDHDRLFGVYQVLDENHLEKIGEL